MKTKNSKLLVIIVIFLLLLAGFALAVIRSNPNDETKKITPEKTTTEAGEENSEMAETQPTPKSATYTINYDVTWSMDTHPQTLPPGPHVSPIVIVAHQSENNLFHPGQPATAGIEMMAETGATAVLKAEIDNNFSISNSVIGVRTDAPGTSSLELTFDQEHSLLSAVSMLAPSPDWFVAVNNVELFDNGQWLENITLVMRPYDAGTDSGATFTAQNANTNPAEVIGPPIDEAFSAAVAEGNFASLTIIRQN